MAAQPLYDTVYDVLLRNQALYVGTHAINNENETGLYHEVCKLLTYFALADLRHDFEKELEIDIYVDARSTQSIGLTQCDYICEAFYSAASKCYKSLSYWARDKFMKEMSSDGTAKANFKKRMDEFFSGTGVFNKFKALFKPSAYSQPFDLSHDEPIAYNSVADKQEIVRILTDEPDQTAILVDSQMGNPLENIFNSDSTKNKAHYIFNFATTMDAATKPTANVHTYLKTYIQRENEIVSLQPLDRQLALFGPQIDINEFNMKDSTWTTTAQIKFTDFPDITMDFSNKSKASVNELAMVPVRGASKEEIDAAVAKLGKVELSQKEAICAAHQFKSLGDRLQALTLSKYLVNSISYVYNTKGGANGELKNDTRTDEAGNTIFHMNKITFINDILNLYQNWLLQNNFVDTGLNIITYYKSQDLEEKTLSVIIDSFKTKKATIHSEIRTQFNTAVDISSLNTFLSSVYNTSVNLGALNYIKNNELLKEFVTDIPEDSTLRDIIKESNYKQYQKLLGPSFHINIKSITNTRMSAASYAKMLLEIDTALTTFNSTISDGNISTNIINHINGFSLIICNLENLFTQLNINKFPFLIALIIVINSGYANINKLITHELFYKSIIEFDGRRSISARKFADATKPLSKDLTATFEQIYKSAFSYIVKNTTEINSIEKIKLFRENVDKIILSGNAAAGGGGGGAGGGGAEAGGGGGGAGVGSKRRRNSDLPNQNDNALNVLSKMASTINLAIYIKGVQLIGGNSVNIVKQLLKLNGYKILDELSPAPAPVAAAAAVITKLVKGDFHPRKLLGFPPFPGTASHALPFAAHGPPVKPLKTREVSLTPASLIEKYPDSSSSSFVSTITNAINNFSSVLSVFFHRRRTQGGGSRSRSKRYSHSYSYSPNSKMSLTYLVQAVRMKLFFMNLFLSKNHFAGCTLFNSEIYGAMLLSDYETIISAKSKKTFVIIQSSVKQASAKGQPKSMVIASPSKSSHHSVMFKSPEGKVKSIFKSQEEVKNKLIQQLIAFLWFGFSQSAEMKKLEKTIFSSLLPDFVNDLSSVVHYQLFWMPFMNRMELSYEDLDGKFTEIALPIMRATPTDLASNKVKSVKAKLQTKKSSSKSQVTMTKQSASQRTRKSSKKTQVHSGRLSTINEANNFLQSVF